MVARVGGWLKKVKGLGSTHWQIQNSHGDVKYSIGKIVNNIVISMYGANGVLEISGGDTLHTVYLKLVQNIKILNVNCNRKKRF